MSGERAAKNIAGGNTVVSAGTGLASAASASAATAPPSTTIVQNQVGTPLILPGLFTTAVGQSAIPVDRISIDYGYFNGFRVIAPATISSTGAFIPSSGIVAGFNLHTFTLTVEKTFFDGFGSVYVNVPFLNATENISGQAIDGLGDVAAGFKIALWSNRETGSTLSAGLTVAAPTGRDSIVTSFSTTSTDGSPLAVSSTASTTVNPTYLQPWVAGVVAWDRLFIHEYLGVVIPTDDRVATLLNNQVTFGYTLFSDNTRALSSFTPTIGVQLLVPLNHRGIQGSSFTFPPIPVQDVPPPPPTTPTAFGFPDQLFLSGGAQLGLGQSAFLSASVVTPVVGPRGYSVGGTVGLSFLY